MKATSAKNPTTPPTIGAIMTVPEPPELVLELDATDVAVGDEGPVAVADTVGRSLNVTPAAAQIASAAAIAVARSEPVQVLSMQAAVLETKTLLLQRQALSVVAQPPRSAEAIHSPAQEGMFWRLNRECAMSGALDGLAPREES